MKKDYHILIIFGTNIPDTTGHRPLKLPHHPMSASELPGEIGTHENRRWNKQTSKQRQNISDIIVYSF